jgi:hypothetical protein
VGREEGSGLNTQKKGGGADTQVFDGFYLIRRVWKNILTLGYVNGQKSLPIR